jgi:hypothetical protein
MSDLPQLGRSHKRHALATIGERVDQLVHPSVVLTEPSARRQHHHLPGFGPYELVDDDAAVDLDLTFSHARSSSGSAEHSGVAQI